MHTRTNACRVGWPPKIHTISLQHESQTMRKHNLTTDSTDEGTGGQSRAELSKALPAFRSSAERIK